MTITAAQCRSARTLLSWSVSRLASATWINRCEIDDFELERRVPHTETRETIRHALEAAGIVSCLMMTSGCTGAVRGPAIAEATTAGYRWPPYLAQQADEFSGFPR